MKAIKLMFILLISATASKSFAQPSLAFTNSTPSQYGGDVVGHNSSSTTTCDYIATNLIIPISGLAFSDVTDLNGCGIYHWLGCTSPATTGGYWDNAAVYDNCGGVVVGDNCTAGTSGSFVNCSMTTVYVDWINSHGNITVSIH